MRSKVFTFVVVATVFALVGLVEQSLGADHYVGKLEGGPQDARIAAVVKNKQLVAYACGSEQDFNQRYAVWFKGALAKDGSFAGAAQGVSVKLQVNGETATGELNDTDSKIFQFRATKVPEEGIAGIYRAEAGDFHVIGAIIDQEHVAVGNSRNKKTGQVVPLRSGTTLPRPVTTGKVTAKERKDLQVSAQKSLTVSFPDGIEKAPRTIKVDPTGIAPKRGVDTERSSLLQAQRVLNPAALPKGVFVK